MDEIADAAIFLLENGAVNGVNLEVDGGWLLVREPRVAVLGLGKMGEAIAERVLDAGYPLSVFNRTAERAEPLGGAARPARRSAADAPARRRRLHHVLADDAALEAVVLASTACSPARAGARCSST